MRQFREFYGIGTFNNALDFFNSITFNMFFNGENKDRIINGYITLMDIISITGVCGIIESLNLLTQFKPITQGIIFKTACIVFSGVSSFVNIYIIPNIRLSNTILSKNFISYVLLPCIGAYIIVNMDSVKTIVTNNKDALYNYSTAILYGLNSYDNIARTKQNDDVSVRSENSIASIVSSINNIKSNDQAFWESESGKFIFNAIRSDNSYARVIYNNDDIMYFDVDDNSTIATNNSQSQNTIITQDSIIPDYNSDSENKGGKKKYRVTKKHKRINIGRSKKSKKMKGYKKSKKTRSTKKRRVILKKHNTKKY
jgi:hypothetical protein